MKVELFQFQEQAVKDIMLRIDLAHKAYKASKIPQVISFTAPTGSGKTIIMSAVIEAIFYGDYGTFEEHPDAIVVWLSDSPALNEQSKQKIDSKADKIRLNQCVVIKEDSFNQEMLDEGKIYFLNTQKLSKSGNLTHYSDSRQYTIWDTLRNTVEEKSDKLYFIIDEAHRGMQGSEAGKATTIMQKFLKGSNADNLPAMPVVIGMSATTQRFDKLIANINASTHKVNVDIEEVRKSGLLKDWIVLSHPGDNNGNNDYAILECAADEWRDKCVRWDQYSRIQHEKQVYPVFVIQVANSTSESYSATDLDECIAKIEARIGIKFQEHEIVHTFGDVGTITVNGLPVEHIEPERISDDKNIKLVFFKENLSTGWDCPRAETMMSFRSADDATYIAQLLGRMIRTPLQRHIEFDESLNDVHVFLPHYNQTTVDSIIEELQNTEGGNIPTYVEDETIGSGTTAVLTCRPSRQRNRRDPVIPGQGNVFDFPNDTTETPSATEETTHTINQTVQQEESNHTSSETFDTTVPNSNNTNGVQQPLVTPPAQSTRTNTSPTPTAPPPTYHQPDLFVKEIDRDTVVDAINNAGLLTFQVRTARTIDNYLAALFKISRIISRSNIYKDAEKQVKMDIVKLVHDYIQKLKDNNLYTERVNKILAYNLTQKKFDPFGKSYEQLELFTTSDTDLDRKTSIADKELGDFGLSQQYGRFYYDDENPNSHKLDVVIFSQDDEQIRKLHKYAKEKFEELENKYRRAVRATCSENDKKAYNNIVAGVDLVSKHLWEIPENVKFNIDPSGKKYYDHLFVDENQEPPYAQLKLNAWEDGVLREEQKRTDFVTWIRNPSEARNTWALVIPYQKEGVFHGAHPDMVIVRQDQFGYVFDILEPHNPEFKDNLGKSIGFAKYVAESESAALGRVQIIREATNDVGRKGFKRLDLSKIEIREKIKTINNTDELDNIFDNYGFFESFS